MTTIDAPVIAAIIGVIGAFAGGVLKTLYDWITMNRRLKERFLDKIDEYTKKYYLPLITRAERLCYYLDRINKEQKVAAVEKLKKNSFFFFVMFIKAKHRLDKELGGGVLLNSFDLECKIRGLIMLIAGMDIIDLPDNRLLIKVKGSELDSFLLSKPDSSSESNTELLEIYAKYKSYISKKENRDYLITLIKVFAELFHYGINDIFYLWYKPWYKPWYKLKCPDIPEEILKKL